jgi:hypothetical protein
MSGNGVILERLSGKKLAILIALLLTLQIFFFLIGAFKCKLFLLIKMSNSNRQTNNFIINSTQIVPNSTHTETVEGILCRDSDDAIISSSNSQDEPNIYYLRDNIGRSNSNCERISVDQNVKLPNS